MMLNPRIGQRVQLWYAKKWHSVTPHHGKMGTVTVASRGRPRNHGVKLADGTRLVVPCGNLRKP